MNQIDLLQQRNLKAGDATPPRGRPPSVRSRFPGLNAVSEVDDLAALPVLSFIGSRSDAPGIHGIL